MLSGFLRSGNLFLIQALNKEYVKTKWKITPNFYDLLRKLELYQTAIVVHEMDQCQCEREPRNIFLEKRLRDFFLNVTNVTYVKPPRTHFMSGPLNS